MDRLPREVEVIWFQSRPRIDFKLTGSDRGTVTFQSDDPDDMSGLLSKLVNGYAHLFVHAEQLKRENRALRAKNY